ncbi:hypothetical protein HDV00_003919 [Rhizophlyctis rosea]|nr:hypothetical protein HDV00_003919 [Rhizophlyctis rosea]
MQVPQDPAEHILVDATLQLLRRGLQKYRPSHQYRPQRILDIVFNTMKDALHPRGTSHTKPILFARRGTFKFNQEFFDWVLKEGTKRFLELVDETAHGLGEWYTAMEVLEGKLHDCRDLRVLAAALVDLYSKDLGVTFEEGLEKAAADGCEMEMVMIDEESEYGWGTHDYEWKGRDGYGWKGTDGEESSETEGESSDSEMEEEGSDYEE